MDSLQTTQNYRQTAVKSQDLISKLRDQAKKDQAFSAVCAVFALRERTRQQVTMHTLKDTMQKKGFNFSDEQLSTVLSFLAANGIGKIDSSPKGKVKALKDIKITLQSIGKAALNGDNKISPFKVATRYDALNTAPPAQQPASVVKAPLKAPQSTPTVKTGPRTFKIAVTIDMLGTQVTLPIPTALAPDELSSLLTKLLGADVTK